MLLKKTVADKVSLVIAGEMELINKQKRSGRQHGF